MDPTDTFVVITGGPGAGKTTLIHGLRQQGFTCLDEAGRQIIRDQSAIGGNALHNADQTLFAEIMLAWEMRSYRQAPRHDTTVFFDRGVPDLVGYYLLLDRPVPRHVSAAADLFRYHHRVFIAPHKLWAGGGHKTDRLRLIRRPMCAHTTERVRHRGRGGPKRA